MLKILSFLLLFTSGCFVYSQYSLDWVGNIGSSTGGYADVKDIKLDDFGHLYVFGDFSGTVDFDPTSATYNMTSTGGTNAFILKLDTLGNFIWVKVFGDPGNCFGSEMEIDKYGNIHMLGRFFNSADFDPDSGVYNLISTGSVDVFVVKLDSSGNFLWARSYGGSLEDYANGIEVDQDGFVYSVGGFRGACDFDPGGGTYSLTSVGTVDAFVHKLDSSGNFVWVKTIEGNSYSQIRTFDVDANGNLILAGTFTGTTDVDPNGSVFNLSSSGSADVFIEKLDSNGNFFWAYPFGGNLEEVPNSLKVDSIGQIFITGFFKGTCDFDPGAGLSYMSSNGERDAFVLKLDPSAGLLWVHSMGDFDDDQGNDIDVDKNGNVFLTGLFEGSVDFDPGPGTYLIQSYSRDAFVQVLDSLGNLKWVGIYADAFSSFSYYVLGYCLSVDDQGSVFTSGEFLKLADFDPSSADYYVNGIGWNDYYISKLNHCIFPETPQVLSSSSIVCEDSALTLEIVTGNLNGANSWNWFQFGCDGSFLGSGTTMVLIPAGSTTYYVRGVGGCDHVDSCTSISVFVSEIDIFPVVVDEILGDDGAVLLTIQGNAPPFNVTWTGPGGYTSNSEDIYGLSGGTYSAFVTDSNGCSQLVDIIVNSYLHTADNEIDIQVYPNPINAGGKLKIDCEFSGNAGIQVENVVGELVWDIENLKISEIELPEQIIPGIYVLKMIDRDQKEMIFSMKLIVL